MSEKNVQKHFDRQRKRPFADVKADEPRERPMTDQPTDAGMDREAWKLTRNVMAMLSVSSSAVLQDVVDAIAQALAAARAEGARQERQLLDDARMYLASTRRMLADTDINDTPWFDGLTRTITAIRSREETKQP